MREVQNPVALLQFDLQSKKLQSSFFKQERVVSILFNFDSVYIMSESIIINLNKT